MNWLLIAASERPAPCPVPATAWAGFLPCRLPGTVWRAPGTLGEARLWGEGGECADPAVGRSWEGEQGSTFGASEKQLSGVEEGVPRPLPDPWYFRRAGRAVGLSCAGLSPGRVVSVILSTF